MNATGLPDCGQGSPRRLLQARAARLLTALLLPALLAACATAPGGPQQADADDDTAIPVRVKPQRMLARDILREWGTFGLDPRPRARRAAVARTPVVPAQPDLSPTIREIMAAESCRDCEQKPYHGLVLKASEVHGVPAALIHAVIQQESGYNPAATSPRQARGLMQVTPGTGRMLGVANSAALYDPHTNINAGTAYLRMLMESHDTMDEVLAAYNAGPGNVRRYNGVPPFGETRRYVHEVKRSFVLTSSE